jgi:hypothetical protein
VEPVLSREASRPLLIGGYDGPTPSALAHDSGRVHPSVGGDSDPVRFPSLEGTGVGVASLAYF